MERPLRCAAAVWVLWTAADGDEVPAAVATGQPDVVLMDLRMSRVDGITATERLVRAGGGAQVLVLTTFDADAEVLGALRAGAAGFLLKDTPPREIVGAIERVAAGERSEEHTSELQSLMRISYAVFCLKKKK